MNINELRTDGILFLQSTINGEFEGFDEGTSFELINGDIWKQRTYEYWHFKSFNQQVSIYQYKSRYYLVVEEYDKHTLIVK